MDTAGLPAAFDARTAWPQCESISDIWDQSNCGDCWAVATVTAAADRMCIATSKEGAGAAPTMTRLSVEHMVGCCRACGYGCGGGFPNYAWAWLAGKKGMPYGVVSGGGYQDYSWCSAYSLKPCNHYHSLNNTEPSCEAGIPAKTPQCPAACDAQSTYNTSFAADVRRFASAYAVPKAPAQIMAEIQKNGPVTAGMNVYQDWLSYRSGVYEFKRSSELVGGHAVKIIGWGLEDGKAYWLVSNSFGRSWGDDGYFKIGRGKDTCIGGGERTCIEDSVVAGTYK